MKAAQQEVKHCVKEAKDSYRRKVEQKLRDKQHEGGLGSLQIGRVPTLWKTSRIVPVPKKNRPSELNDFRPVALTSHLMKTLERLFLSLLRPQPTLLRDKLGRMGVDPQLMDWISDYLTGRPQYVGLKDITSDTVVSSTGAPQGTVLAPLLFTLYTSDFCYNSELCHIQKYADDTAIVGVHQG
ncbi:hypothetical protein L3Q82_002808 [Scortum barcoo]|uniref:Uncharacterized protein n=1 Tax=Scortum barcoo TaxID=214431 RepID=A0ACB8VWI5_9TELE|nr:hypothetical protein L3Q82_002808 [Scortum barcoo]